MNAEELLRHYERVADAPDATTRLRRFVLDLAVRGKLVPPNPIDEAADLLLGRLLAERERRIAAGEFRERSSAALIEREKLPFSPPPHWRWARLIDLAQPSYGFAFASGQFNGSKRGMPLIRIRDISGIDTEAYFDGPFDPAYLVNPGDYLVGMDGDFNLRRWRGKPGLLNQRVLRINSWRCGVSPEFVKLPLQFILDHLHGQTSQTTVKHLSAKQVNGIEIPLPPLAEQHRIVAKVDELMALCDRLEAARAERDAARYRLTAASLARLNTPDPATFREDARFALDALPALTARDDQIKQLRLTLLELAFRGHLTQRQPQEEAGVELRERILAAWGSRAHGIKRGDGKNADGTHSDEAAFPTPKSWGWISLQLLCEQIGDIDHKMPRAVSLGVPFLSAKDLRDDGSLDFSDPKFISEEDFQRLSRKILPRRGDIIYSRIGARLGKARLVEVDTRFLISYSCCLIRPLKGFIDDRYLQVFLDSPLALRQAHGGIQSIGVPDLGLGEIRAYRVPLPSLAEQRRLVAAVSEVMSLCDRLEASLVNGEDVRRRLLEAFVQEALRPAEALEEAA